MNIKTYYANEAKDMLSDASFLFELAREKLNMGEYKASYAISDLAKKKHDAGLDMMKLALTKD